MNSTTDYLPTQILLLLHWRAHHIFILSQVIQQDIAICWWTSASSLAMTCSLDWGFQGGGCDSNLRYRGADKSLARPTSQCILFDGENSSFDASLVIYRVSQEEWTKLRESVPYVKLYRYNPKHLHPKLNGYGDNGQRKVWTSCIST